MRNDLQKWWLTGGVRADQCVAAYQPIRAGSLQSSYINLAKPGTYNAAPGIAPTFDANAGWSFNGSTQYLNTGIVPADNQSLLIRYIVDPSYTGMVIVGGRTGVGTNNGLFLHPSVYYRYGGSFYKEPAVINGVIGVAGKTAIRNGLPDGTISEATINTTDTMFIGALNTSGEAGAFCKASVQAMAHYNTILTNAQVAAITNAMNLL